MEGERVLVRMDRQGRVLIPASVRRRVRTSVFLLELEGDLIVLKPLKPTPLTSLFDLIPVDVSDFTDTHELRCALAGEGAQR